jgi:hypothetical protein
VRVRLLPEQKDSAGHAPCTQAEAACMNTVHFAILMSKVLQCVPAGAAQQPCISLEECDATQPVFSKYYNHQYVWLLTELSRFTTGSIFSRGDNARQVLTYLKSELGLRQSKCVHNFADCRSSAERCRPRHDRFSNSSRGAPGRWSGLSRTFSKYWTPC